MAYRSLSSLVPSAADLLSLEVEELAGILLVHLNSRKDLPGDTVFQRGEVSHTNFFNSLSGGFPRAVPEYGDRQDEVNRALLEAWAWLQSEALLVMKSSAGWYIISRRAERLLTREDFGAYRKAQLLPKAQIHPVISSRVYPAFLRGEYDTAIFQAFREVEVAVRQAGGFGQDLIGDELMRKAFAPVKGGGGSLTDAALPAGEQLAMSHLFAGAFGVYRNSTAHRYVPTEASAAAEVIMFASQLLRIVDDRARAVKSAGQR